jgi:MFS superfamily sulfate permease-like transporter
MKMVCLKNELQKIDSQTLTQYALRKSQYDEYKINLGIRSHSLFHNKFQKGMSQQNFNPLHNLKHDLPAALVVFLVALPLCLGVALASGAPLFSGIIAGAVGGIIIGVFSNSPLSVSGPAAGLTVIVLTSIQKMPTYEAFLLAVVLSGALQIAFGFLKAGVVGDFIPSSVIKGMLSAIGLILILKQIPHAFGYDKDPEGDMSFAQADGENTFSEIWHLFDHYFSIGAAIVALVSIGILLLWDNVITKKIAALKLVPAPLLVVVTSVLLNEWFKTASPNLTIMSEHLVSIPVANDFKGFLGQFKLPDFSQIMNPNVWIIAGTIAIVASLESLLSIEAIDRLDPFKRNTDTNRELTAQGIGNMVSGMLGGLPVTSVIVRSSANVNSGGRTKASTITHGSMLLLSVYFIPQVLNLIPLSALAAILIMTGYKLAKPALFVAEYKRGWSHFAPFVITIVAILLTDLLKGILVGIGAGAYFIMLANYRSAMTLVKEEAGHYLLNFKKDVSFVHKVALKKMLSSIPNNSHVIIDMHKTSFIDKDNEEIIDDFMTTAHYRDITVEKIEPTKVPQNTKARKEDLAAI